MGNNLFKIVVLGLMSLLLLAGCSGDDAEGSSDKVTIKYWQYTYPSKVEEIDKLVKQFEEENPDIDVVAQDYPYDQYQDKIFATEKAGKGPDIMNIYYGWIADYAKKDYIQPIRSEFMSKEEIQNYYGDMVQPQALDGKYYTMPTAVRSLALFWNKDLFEEAGLDPNKPPKTWDELVRYAKKITKFKEDGRYEQEGFAWNASGQGKHTFEEVILRQWGVQPYSDDGKKILWNSSPEGLEAFKFWMGMTTEEKIGSEDFGQDYNTAFISGRAGMMIDGSFRIGDVKEGASFDWGVTTLPVREEGGLKSNFASYWTNAIATGVSGEKLEASEKFLKFLSSEEVQKDWMKNVGELPSAQALLEDESITGDPIYGPFVKGLNYAHATFYANETQERDVLNNGVDQIRLKDAPVEETFNNIVKEIQKIRDEFFEK